jgi:valyl-tRNA synthetase
LDKKIAELTKLAKSLEDKINAKDYTTKVPEEVQKQNTEKLSGYHLELDKVLEAKKTISSL